MKILKRILPFIGIALFIYLIIRIGISNVIDNILNARIHYIILTLLFIVPVVLLQAAKWYAILKQQRIKIKFADIIKMQLISMFYGAITPARIGSFIKIAYLQQKLKNFGKSASSVVIDRGLDMLTVLLFACIGTIIIINQFPKMAVFIFSVFILFLVIFLMIISKNRGQRIARVLYDKLLPKRIKNKTKKGFKEFYSNIPKKRKLIIPFILNIATWIAIYSQVFLAAKAVNINISYFAILFMFPIATIIAEIPISIGGLGIREASLITLLGIFGVKADSVMSMSIISLITTNLLPAIGGVFLTLRGYRLKIK